MNSIDTFSMAAKNLYKRKLRTLLTVLGVVIGAGAIIIMVSLGLAINQGFEERMMTTPNATVIELFDWGQNPFTPRMDDNLLAQIAQIPGVSAVTPWVSFWMNATIGRYIGNGLDIIGVFPEALPYMGFELTEGEFLTADNEFGMLFGANVAAGFMTQREWEDPRAWSRAWERMMEGGEASVNVMSSRIRFSVDWNFGFRQADEADAAVNGGGTRPPRVYNGNVVGVLAQGEHRDSTRGVFMNVATVQALIEERERWQDDQRQEWGWGGGVNPALRNQRQQAGYQSVFVRAADVNALDGVIESLERMGFSLGSTVGQAVLPANMWYAAAQVRELRETMTSLQVLLGVMGGISLVIAAINIMNTMVMSTIERTKEIGVMKVIGASLRDIRKLFLLESALIGLIGGILGVALSYATSHFLNVNGLDFFAFVNIQQMEMEAMPVSIIPAWLSGLSLLFAAIIGLAAGFLPAQRATRLSALAAIRND